MHTPIWSIASYRIGASTGLPMRSWTRSPIQADLEALKNRDFAEWAERFAVEVAKAGQLICPDRTVTVRFVEEFTFDPQPGDQRVGDQQIGLPRVLWATALDNTPLPGTNILPNVHAHLRPGQALRALQLWPHRRLPLYAVLGWP